MVEEDLTRVGIEGRRDEPGSIRVEPCRGTSVFGCDAGNGRPQLGIQTADAIDVLGGVAQSSPGQQGTTNDDHGVLWALWGESRGDLFDEPADLWPTELTLRHQAECLHRLVVGM